MATRKKNNAVVFGLTSNHIFGVACVMMDLKRLSPGKIDEVVIFHDGVKASDRRLLNSILPTRFILYDFPLHSPRVLRARATRQFSKMVFTKFECLRLLDDYRNVMWLDYDMVIQDDISELFAPCPEGLRMMPGELPVRGQLLADIAEYDMEAEGVCACLFVFHDNLPNFRGLYDFCYSKLDQYAEKLYMPEQAVFDFMLQEFKLAPAPLSVNVYSPHPTNLELAPRAKIIHAYGQPKFWNGLNNEHWNSNYHAWIGLGGSPYKKPSSVLMFLRKVRNRLQREGSHMSESLR